MASLKDIRKRISSVKSTQQITQAMKMVAASKLRRAQQAITQARPYADRLDALLQDLSPNASEGEKIHPLLQRRAEIKKVEVLIFTSDRGLCGGFNSNLLRRAMRFVHEHEHDFEEITFSVVGRRGNEFLKRRTGFGFGEFHANLLSDVQYPRAHAMATGLSDRYISGEVDAVFVLYNEFRSVISQVVTLKQLLPVGAPIEALANDELAQAGAKAEAPKKDEQASALQGVDYLFEPSQQGVLTRLIPAWLSTQVWRALLESVASENGARMGAMDNATRNAGDMIERLSLIANRTRQAAITTELMEIVSGAEALK